MSTSGERGGREAVSQALVVLDLGERGHRLDLRGEAVGFLRSVVKSARPGGRQVMAAVAAARSILEEVRWHDERELSPERIMRELLGSEEALLAWMEETLPKVRARIEAKRNGAALLAPPEVQDG